MAYKHLAETLINKNGYGCIYCITNTVNGKQYIGQTRKEYVSARWSEHKYNTKNNKENMKLYDAMRKYGVENFIFEVIEFDVPIEKLWDKEIYYIDKLKTLFPNGYNFAKGGGGTLGVEPWDKGHHRSDETKEKIREAYTEKKRKEASIRMSGKNNPMYGRSGKLNPMYNVHKYGTENPFFGKHHSDETKTRLSKANNERKKQVVMIDIDTDEELCVFESLSKAREYLVNNGFKKADDAAISKCARGIYKTVYKHKWKFVGE